jgi:hypothetical protein
MNDELTTLQTSPLVSRQSDIPPDASADSITSKLQFVRGLLEQRQHLIDIHRMFSEKFCCTRRTARRFIVKHYELLRLDTDKPIADHLVDAFAFYLSIVRDSSNTTRDRMHAQERIDKLIGLDAALKLKATESNDPTLNHTPPNQAEIRQLVAAALAKAAIHAEIPARDPNSLPVQPDRLRQDEDSGRDGGERDRTPTL